VEAGELTLPSPSSPAEAGGLRPESRTPNRAAPAGAAAPEAAAGEAGGGGEDEDGQRRIRRLFGALRVG